MGSVLGQAIAREAIKLEERGRAYSTISIAMAFAPAIGPIFGGTIVQYTHWSNIFLVLGLLAMIIILQIYLFIPETNFNINSNQLKKMLFKSCLKQMINDKVLLGFGFLIGGVNGILFGYFAESPFYFIEYLGLVSSAFGLLSFAICLPLALGGIISKKMHKKNFSSNQIIHYGIRTIISGSALFYFLTYTPLIY